MIEILFIDPEGKPSEPIQDDLTKLIYNCMVGSVPENYDDPQSHLVFKQRFRFNRKSVEYISKYRDRIPESEVPKLRELVRYVTTSDAMVHSAIGLLKKSIN
jgi:hypothetical protein